jgi:two-component system response regulator
VGSVVVRDETSFFLLVEDNPDDELLTRRALKKSNVCNEVVVAHDGAEALDYLFGTGTYNGRDSAVMPQVILLDLDLPKIDGLEVLRRIRSDERTRRLPTVILTSSEDQQDLVEGYGLGANGYVRKPLDIVQFRVAVQQLGLYWVVLNEASRV